MDLAPGNRRRWPRQQANLLVSVRLEGSDVSLTTRSLDVSLRGLFLLHQPPFVLGQRIELDIVVAKARVRCSARGIVMRAVLGADTPGGPAPGEGSGVYLTDVDDVWSGFCARFGQSGAGHATGLAPPSYQLSPDEP